MTKQLTRRQQQFLNQFLEIYRVMDKPIHYSVLAQQLGIGKITAYEMLRLLEKQDLVKSEFHLPSGVRGPGRSEVFFLPTKRAQRLIGLKTSGTDDVEIWEKTKQQILKQLSEGKAGGYETLLNDLLVRIPEQQSPLVYMTEMTTSIILTLESIKKTTEGKGLIDRLRRIGFPGEIGLITLAGISTVLSAILDINVKFTSLFLKQSKKYQEMLIQLSSEKRDELSDFAREISNIVIG